MNRVQLPWGDQGAPGQGGAASRPALPHRSTCLQVRFGKPLSCQAFWEEKKKNKTHTTNCWTMQVSQLYGRHIHIPEKVNLAIKRCKSLNMKCLCGYRKELGGAHVSKGPKEKTEQGVLETLGTLGPSTRFCKYASCLEKSKFIRSSTYWTANSHVSHLSFERQHRKAVKMLTNPSTLPMSP